jgi:hypothetical protein
MLGIWNNIDVAALYFGLDRLQGESNEDFIERLKQISKYQYRNDYYNLAHNIPIQLGLKTSVIGRIFHRTGNLFDCKIDWNYFTLREILPDASIGEYIRVFIGGQYDSMNAPYSGSVKKIKTAIDNCSAFTIEIYNDLDAELSVDYLIRNRNIKTATELINTQHQKLLHENIIPNSFVINSPSFRNLKAVPTDVVNTGEYFIDNKLGYTYCGDYTISEASSQYRYQDMSFALESTDINLIPVRHYFAHGLNDTSLEYIPSLIEGNIAGK